jgi:ABC-type transport system involved in multi-copper enzyme maturation permease subunit
MKTLLWKDYRQSRKVLVATVILVALPYVIGLPFWVAEDFPFGLSLERLADMLYGISIWGTVLAVGMAALIAGNAFAGERADRSAEFAGSLPIPRSRALASKALLTLAACTLLQLPHLVINLLARLPLSHSDRVSHEFLVVTTTTSVLLFGVAWLASSFSSSPAIAAVSGMASAILLAGTLGLLEAHPNPRTGMVRTSYFDSYPVLCIIIGLACFAAGTAYYLRRVEP